MSSRVVSATQLVCDRLRGEIVSGTLGPGKQLRQEELARRYGTSRVPVREALRQLEAEGLVQFFTNRGAVVSSISLEEVLEMFEIRIALECRALYLAIPNMVASDFDIAEAILTSYDVETSPARWSEMNWRFHKTLYAACNRQRLLDLIQTNYSHVDRFTRLQVSATVGKDQPQRDHYRILAACREGDVKTAVTLLEEHISNSMKSLKGTIRLRNAAAVSDLALPARTRG
jgi:DNA-binding GntR family transcriptional regulator